MCSKLSNVTVNTFIKNNGFEFLSGVSGVWWSLVVALRFEVCSLWCKYEERKIEGGEKTWAEFWAASACSWTCGCERTHMGLGAGDCDHSNTTGVEVNL